MSRYHIGKSGQPARCQAASEASCPLGGRHFGTQDEARYYTELQGQQRNVANAPAWLRNALEEAVAELESVPPHAQPHWYRTAGRDQLLAAGARFPNLPPVGQDGDLRDPVARPTVAQRLDAHIIAQQPDGRLLAAMQATEGAEKNMDPAGVAARIHTYSDATYDDESPELSPTIQLLRAELTGRLERAERTLLLSRDSVGPQPAGVGTYRRLQARAAGVQCFRRAWAPRLTGAESTEEVRAHLSEFDRVREHPGYSTYRNEPGFHEGLQLARGYVEEYLRLTA